MPVSLETGLVPIYIQSFSVKYVITHIEFYHSCLIIKHFCHLCSTILSKKRKKNRQGFPLYVTLYHLTKVKLKYEIKLPPALANHLVGHTNKPNDIENVAQVYKTAFPGFQSMESNLQKSLRNGDKLSGIKFPDMGILFGTHNPYHIFADRSDVPNLILPISGLTEIIENDGNKIRNSAADRTGCYFTSKQHAYSKTESVEAIALGFKPDKLLEVLRSVAGNPNISLPEHSFNINFSRGKTRFILERFLFT